MKINKIVLYNFNSFEGMNEFDFSSTCDQKNIVLIGGKNGAGKTSLFTAIKIALYGPLTYGYMGINPHYISKIKDCINSNAFQTDRVKSKVQINISLLIEREVKKYEITREWTYKKQRLEEHFFVKCNDKLLDDKEQSYFQNYLLSIIPPDLFDFFLFDGEEVGNIFSTSTYNTYVRNAVYTLCGLDIFEIIRKQTGRFVGKATTEKETILLDEYKVLKEEADSLQLAISNAELEIDTLQKALEEIETESLEHETVFKNAGGITEAEKEELSKQYREAEQIKVESAVKIKNFVETLMPFYIVKEFAKKISGQLATESDRGIYEYFQQKIKVDDIREILPKSVSDKDAISIVETLFERLKPVGYDESNVQIHDLSQESTARVNALISMLENFDSSEMVRTVMNRQKAADVTMEINKLLKSAMSDEDVAKYKEKENALLRRRDEISKEIFEQKNRLVELNNRMSIVAVERERAFQAVKENTQNKNVYELSSGLTAMMEALLSHKSEKIKNGLENLIVRNLRRIYRKDNLITHIEIDENFKFNLYQDATYTAVELSNLMRNVGKNNFYITIGQKGLDQLFLKYDVNTIADLEKILQIKENDSCDLYKNIDLSRLSKGERQIFILALYWAIIILSNQNIPFVIDTPYARIDANHRKEISEKFFPNISKQVIILSTDEEINEEYYGIIKPYIAKEYLLINDENQNKTTIENRYFFEG